MLMGLEPGWGIPEKKIGSNTGRRGKIRGVEIRMKNIAKMELGK